MKSKIKKISVIICYLWKHEVTFKDGCYDVCKRCEKHEYYDDDFHDGKPILKIYFWFRYKFILFKSWYKLKFFNELPF